MLALPVNIKDIISGHTIEFPIHKAFKETGDMRTVTPPDTPPVKKLIELLARGDKGNAEIRELLALKDRTHLREHCIDPALSSEYIEYTIPGKPNSRLQKYRLTEKGRSLVGIRSD